jgi:peptidoglycan L-alanyl-D-glutamate endopeptidase CwlK
MALNKRSLDRLKGVHQDLVSVILQAADIGPTEFIVTEGLRTKARQSELVAAGASRTMNSRHITGHAVDLAVTVNNEVRWDWPIYDKLAKQVKLAATKLGVKIVWGGDWAKFRDGPHFELDRKAYP